jgi:modulator of FtsH protease
LHGKFGCSLKPLSIRKSYERRESRCDCGFQTKTLLKIGGRFQKFALSGRKSIKCGSLYIAGHVLTNAEDFMNDNVQTLDYGQTISVAERNKVLRNTYLLLALSLLPTVLGAWVGVATGITAALSGMVGLVVFLVGAFGFIYAIEKTKNSAAGVPVLLAFTFFMGLMLSRMIAMVLGFKNGSDLIMTAFGGTAGVFFAMASLATVIKRDISGMGKWLTVGAVLLMVGAIINAFVASSTGMIVISLLAIGIFSAFILYDLKRIIDGGETNYISATLGLYLSLFNVFQSLLALLGIFGGERD